MATYKSHADCAEPGCTQSARWTHRTARDRDYQYGFLERHPWRCRDHEAGKVSLVTDHAGALSPEEE